MLFPIWSEITCVSSFWRSARLCVASTSTALSLRISRAHDASVPAKCSSPSRLQASSTITSFGASPVSRSRWMARNMAVTASGAASLQLDDVARLDPDHRGVAVAPDHAVEQLAVGPLAGEVVAAGSSARRRSPARNAYRREERPAVRRLSARWAQRTRHRLVGLRRGRQARAPAGRASPTRAPRSSPPAGRSRAAAAPRRRRTRARSSRRRARGTPPWTSGRRSNTDRPWRPRVAQELRRHQGKQRRSCPTRWGRRMRRCARHPSRAR